MFMEAAPAHALGGSDMRIDRVRTNVRSAPAGTRVVFKVVAENAGPDRLSSIEVFYDDQRAILRDAFDGYDESLENLDIRAELCYWDHFGSAGPSADSPFCEFSQGGVGDKVYVKVVARLVQRTESHIAALGFRVSNRSGFPDPNPSNNCRRESDPHLVDGV
jgi:hypothetical protein